MTEIYFAGTAFRSHLAFTTIYYPNKCFPVSIQVLDTAHTIDGYRINH